MRWCRDILFVLLAGAGMTPVMAQSGTFTFENLADGTPLTVEEATSRVKNGATVLASSDGKPIAKAWLRAVGSDTVVMVAEGLSHAQPQWGGGALPTRRSPRTSSSGSHASLERCIS